MYDTILSAERPEKLSWVTIPLYLGAAFYALLILGGAGLLGFALLSSEVNGEDAFFVALGAGVMGAMSAVLVAGSIAAAGALKKGGRKWAWIVSIIIAALYAPSIFFFLGVPMLIGLFDEDVRRWSDA